MIAAYRSRMTGNRPRVGQPKLMVCVGQIELLIIASLQVFLAVRVNVGPALKGLASRWTFVVIFCSVHRALPADS